MYSIHTKGGQSGSPVYLKGKENVHLLGIHKAYNNICRLNVAVFITSELHIFHKEDMIKHILLIIKNIY
jgi:V8-like Glu-specific endopeptidase